MTSSRHADYIDAVPVNMLAIPKQVLNASGYLRSFPGIIHKSDVAGLSRGVQYNTHENGYYRGLDNKLYKDNKIVGDIAGTDRIGMAFSRNSQAAAASGKMTLYLYDGTVKTLTNWPKDKKYTQYDIGAVRDIFHLRGRYAWCKFGTDIFSVTDLKNESHPDRYRAESQPDGIIGIDTWRDFIVCFGSSTIEYFSLTGAANGQSAIYVAVAPPALMAEKGIAGTTIHSPDSEGCHRVNLYARVSNRLLHLSIITIDFGQSPATLNHSGAQTFWRARRLRLVPRLERTQNIILVRSKILT